MGTNPPQEPTTSPTSSTEPQGGAPAPAEPAPNPWGGYVEAFDRAGFEPERLPPPDQLVNAVQAINAWRDPDRVLPTAESWLRQANIVPGLGETVSMDEVVQYAQELHRQRSDPWSNLRNGGGDPNDPNGYYEPQQGGNFDPQQFAQAVEQVVEQRFARYQAEQEQARTQAEFQQRIESQLSSTAQKHNLTPAQREAVRSMAMAQLMEGRVPQYEFDSIMERTWTQLQGMMGETFSQMAQRQENVPQTHIPQGQAPSGYQPPKSIREAAERYASGG